MSVPKLGSRINISIYALAICWFVTAIAVGLYAHDPRAFLACLFWSLPQFGAAWVLVVLPVVAMGQYILRIHVIVVIVVGAISGILIILLPIAIVWLLSRGTMHFKWNWEYFQGWPSFG